MPDMQVFQDCEVVIQLISSDIDVEGRVGMLCLCSCQRYIAVLLTPAAVSCDVWLSNGLVSHRVDWSNADYDVASAQRRQPHALSPTCRPEGDGSHRFIGHSSARS